MKSYLQRRKWQYRQVSEEDIALKTCPFCGRSKWKFWIHAQKTMYRCFNCDARGNLYKLKRETGGTQGVVSASQAATGEKAKGASSSVDIRLVAKWHRQLLKHKRTMDYLREGRGFTDETIGHFKLGLQKQGDQLWLAIPHMAGGVCHNVKFRSLPPAEKTFRRIKGAASVLFNADALAEGGSVVIAEAETDAMSLWQAGVKNVVGLTGGAGTFLPEWYDDLADKEEITLCLDADAVGQQGARDIARRLGFDKCRNVLLPYHDANEALTQAGPEELKRSLDTGELFEVAGVISAADVMHRCRERSQTGDVGLLTPWDDVNALSPRGMHFGDLVILSAKYKTGKTTWALNLLDHQSRQGIPCLMYCLEMSVEQLGDKHAALVRHKAAGSLTSVDYELVRHRLRNQPFHYVEPDWRGSLKVESVSEKIREAVKRHGIKLLVFDHLHFLCRSLQYLTAEVGNVVRTFKLLAQELNVVVVLVAQPKKLEGSRVIRSDDIKDSSSIPADADRIVLLHRNPRPIAFDDDSGAAQASDAEVLEPKTIVRIDADRFGGGGECFLYYDGAASTFLDWEDRPAKEA